MVVSSLKKPLKIFPRVRSFRWLRALRKRKKRQTMGDHTTSVEPKVQCHAQIRLRDPRRKMAVRMKTGDVVARRKSCCPREASLSRFFDPKVR